MFQRLDEDHDELLWVGVNLAADNSPANGGTCGRWFWAMHDVNYNVSGLAETGSGAMVERYEYTPYGERTVYSRDFLLADLDQDGDVDEDDADLMSDAIQYNMGDRFDLNGDGDIDGDEKAPGPFRARRSLIHAIIAARNPPTFRGVRPPTPSA